MNFKIRDNRAVFNWVSTVIVELLWFCFTTLCDSQPIRCKTKTNHDLVTRVVPRLAPVTCICFGFSLVHCVFTFVVIGHCVIALVLVNWKATLITNYVNNDVINIVLLWWSIKSYQGYGGRDFRSTRRSDNQTRHSILVQKYRRRGRRLGPFSRLNHVRLRRFDTERVLFTRSGKVVHFVVVDNARAIWSIFWAKAGRRF